MFDNLEGKIWYDDKLVEWKDAKVHVMTHSLHYGSAVYEGMRIYNGKVFKIREHYERLKKSAEYMFYQIPYEVDYLIEKTNQLMKDGGYQNNSYIRALAWCGTKKITISHNDIDIHSMIAIWERPIIYPETHYTIGIRLNVATYRRPDPKTAPTSAKAAGLYMISSISKKQSELLGFNDALMLDYRGFIAEATSSNFFMIKNGVIYTPFATCFLNGITRLTVIDIARNLGIEVIEGEYALNFLEDVTEVFLTGTAVEILPVGEIVTAEKIYKFSPGEISKKIRNEYLKLVNL